MPAISPPNFVPLMIGPSAIDTVAAAPADTGVIKIGISRLLKKC